MLAVAAPALAVVTVPVEAPAASLAGTVEVAGAAEVAPAPSAMPEPPEADQRERDFTFIVSPYEWIPVVDGQG